MEPSHDTAGASDLAELGAAARTYLRENPPEGVEVPAHPAVRMAAGACDFVVGMFFCFVLGCPLSLLVASVVGTIEGAGLRPIFSSFLSLAAAIYTLPEAFGSRTLAKSWFRFRVSATELTTSRRSLRRRWLVKASPWLLLATIWAAGTTQFATRDSMQLYQPHWVRDLDPRWTFLGAAAAVLLMFVPCFGVARQSLYDRAAGALVVRTVPLRQQRGHGFDVVPMATLAQAPSEEPAGVAAPAGGGYPPAADHE